MESVLNDTQCILFETKNFTFDGFELFKYEKQEYFMDYFAFGVPFLKLLICLIGIIANALNIVALTRSNLSASINIQLATLEAINLILYVTFFYEFAMFFNKNWVILFSEHVSVLSAISYCVSQTCICISNWLTVTIGLWRFVAITFPLQASNLCTQLRSKLVCVLVLLSSIALWSYYYFSFECLLYVYNLTSSTTDSTVEKQIAVGLTGNWRHAETDATFKLYFPIAVLLSTAVPCTLLMIVSFALILRLWMARSDRKAMNVPKRPSKTKVIQEVEKHNFRKERRITLALTAMILMYFLTYLPDSIISIMYWFYPQSYIQTLFICQLAWNRCGILFCNSLTIIFYCIMSKKLRYNYLRILYWPFALCWGQKLKNGLYSPSIPDGLDSPSPRGSTMSMERTSISE